MDAKLGWLLAVVGLVAGWQAYGWQGVVLVISVVVFWLLLQFSRTMRVMRKAGAAPLALVPSVVMLQARLKPGLPMLKVLGMTGCLGRRLPDGEDVWRWEDEGGAGLVLHFEQGRLRRWTLERPADSAALLQEGDASPAAPEARP